MKILTILILLAFSVPAKAGKGIAVPPDTAGLNADTLYLIANNSQTIENEIALPFSEERSTGSFPSKSQETVKKQIFALAELGPAYADQIYNMAMTKESRTRAALVIALGLLKDDRVKDDVREIVRWETNPYMRAYAVRALSMYADTLDIPLFLEAMADTNIVVIHGDIQMPDGSFSYKVGIVANAAVPALYKLGYKWELDSINGGYKAVKIEK